MKLRDLVYGNIVSAHPGQPMPIIPQNEQSIDTEAVIGSKTLLILSKVWF
jgi:hypothetical protein